MTQPTCILGDCDKPSRNPKSAALCPMHYHRQYRHGSTDKVAHESGITVSLGRRYRRISATNHPLADKSGGAYEHRVVLYDAIGTGPHPCHWCSAEVDWLPKGDPRCLQVDHVNGDGADNRAANLVPSCGGCNTARALQARSEALRVAGWWSRNDTIAHLASGGRRPLVGAGRSNPSALTG